MARSPLLPLPDYQRIYQVTHSVLEASEIAITHRACIFFASVGALILRGQFDGIASFDDLVEFFKRLPNPDKQFTVMAGISHASFQQINYMMVYHILLSFFSQPAPVYRG